MNGLALTLFADGQAASITSGVDTVVSVFGKVWDLIVGNQLMLVFVGASLLGIGLGLFRRVKRAAR